MANYFEGKIEIDFDPNQLNEVFQKKAAKAFEKVANELEGRFTDAIQGGHWDWPRESKRGVRGSTVGEKAAAWAKKPFNTGTPRSITDSGQLAASLDVDLDAAGLKAEFTWDVDYAAAVHEGAYISPWGNKKAQKVYLPARPWTEAVIHGTHGVQRYDYLDRFSKYFSQG